MGCEQWRILVASSKDFAESTRNAFCVVYPDAVVKNNSAVVETRSNLFYCTFVKQMNVIWIVSENRACIGVFTD